MAELERFMSLYRGLDRAYGTYEIDLTLAADGNKKKVGGKPLTIRAPLKKQVWVEHLKGGRGLGIIPLCDGDFCYWAALDIDSYNFDVCERVNEAIRAYDLPCVTCRSKSGGAHVYFYFKQPIGAELVIKKLKEFSEGLGFAGCEIFPKQKKHTKDSTGNWINLPYHNWKETVRYAYNSEGKKLTFAEFLDYGEAMRDRIPSAEVFLDLKVPEGSAPFSDGPPCLQRLAMEGVSDFRNNALFNFAVYAKKRFPDDSDDAWKDRVSEYNDAYMKPPLKYSEMAGSIFKMKDKDYKYRCRDAPCRDVCNRNLCSNRAFGIYVDGGTGGIELSNIRKEVQRDIDGRELNDQVRWIICVDGVDVKLTSDELLSPEIFARRVFDASDFLAVLPPARQWKEMVHQKIEDSKREGSIPREIVPFEITEIGRLLAALRDYLRSSNQAIDREDLRANGGALREDGFHCFKIAEFQKYLRDMRIPIPGGSKISDQLKSIGCTHHETTVTGNKKLNMWKIKSEYITSGDDEGEDMRPIIAPKTEF